MGKACNNNCSVYGCNSKKSRDPSVHFHQYPAPNKGTVIIVNNFGVMEEIDRRNAWILKLKRERPVGKYTLVCSKHFTQEDYLSGGVCKVKPKLKLTAVPSTNLPKFPRNIRKADGALRIAQFAKIQKTKARKEPSISQNFTEVEKNVNPFGQEVLPATATESHIFDNYEPGITIKYEEDDELDEDCDMPQNLEDPIKLSITSVPMELPQLQSPTSILENIRAEKKTLRKYYYDEKLKLLKEKNFIKRQKLEVLRQKLEISKQRFEVNIQILKSLEGLKGAFQNTKE